MHVVFRESDKVEARILREQVSDGGRHLLGAPYPADRVQQARASLGRTGTPQPTSRGLYQAKAGRSGEREEK